VAATTRAADLVASVLARLGEGTVSRIYNSRVRTERSRRFELPPPARPVLVQHTLLGIELQIGGRRLLCPDLATARYLAVFARLGCPEVAVPYDITRISVIADELESAWQRTLLLLEHGARDRSPHYRARALRLAASAERLAVQAAGAGPVRPEFRTETRQRPLLRERRRRRRE
jgi:hypothetical protein